MSFKKGDLVRGNCWRKGHANFDKGWSVGTFDRPSPHRGLGVSYIIVNGGQSCVFTDTLELVKPAFDLTKPVQTESGKPVRILCTDGPHKDFPVVGIVEGLKWPYQWSKDGNCCNAGRSWDLVQAPPPKKKITKWFVMWEDGHAGAFKTFPDSRPGDPKIIAKKEITITEGEGMEIPYSNGTSCGCHHEGIRGCKCYEKTTFHHRV